MREILFRGKRIDNGAWVYGYLASYDLIASEYPNDVSDAMGKYYDEIPYVGFVDVDPETVGQYTGLPDKNGKKIFEGDIVTGLFSFGMEVKAVVAFQNGAFGLRWSRGGAEQFSAFTSICNMEFDVIGNIHDNPELLEV